MDYCEECGLSLSYVGEGPLCFECIHKNHALDQQEKSLRAFYEKKLKRQKKYYQKRIKALMEI